MRVNKELHEKLEKAGVIGNANGDNFEARFAAAHPEYNTELSDLEKKLAEAKNALAEAQKVSKAAKGEIDDANQKVTDAKVEVVAKKEGVAKAEENLNKNTAEIADLEKLVEAAQKKYNDENSKDNKKKLEKVNKNLAKAQSKTGELEAALNEAKKEEKNANDDLVKVQEAAKELAEKLAKANEGVQKAQGNVNSLNAAVNAKKDYEAKSDEEKKQDKENKINAFLQKEIDEVLGKIKALNFDALGDKHDALVKAKEDNQANKDAAAKAEKELLEELDGLGSDDIKNVLNVFVAINELYAENVKKLSEILSALDKKTLEDNDLGSLVFEDKNVSSKKIEEDSLAVIKVLNGLDDDKLKALGLDTNFSKEMFARLIALNEGVVYDRLAKNAENYAKAAILIGKKALLPKAALSALVYSNEMEAAKNEKDPKKRSELEKKAHRKYVAGYADELAQLRVLKELVDIIKAVHCNSELAFLNKDLKAKEAVVKDAGDNANEAQKEDADKARKALKESEGRNNSFASSSSVERDIAQKGHDHFVLLIKDENAKPKPNTKEINEDWAKYDIENKKFGNGKLFANFSFSYFAGNQLAALGSWIANPNSNHLEDVKNAFNTPRKILINLAKATVAALGAKYAYNEVKAVQKSKIVVNPYAAAASVAGGFALGAADKLTVDTLGKVSEGLNGLSSSIDTSALDQKLYGSDSAVTARKHKI